MLEIIILIFVCKKIGTIATEKGLNPSAWKIYTVISWVIAEFIGLGLAMLFFGFSKNNIGGIMAFALASAFGGYLIVRAVLERKPDQPLS